MLNRGLLTLGFFVVGLDAIYFGCIENGSNNRRNPLWELLSEFVDLEKLALGTIGIVIGVSVFCQTGIWIFDRIKRHQNIKRIKISLSQNPFEVAEELKPKPMPSMTFREAERLAAKPKIEPVKKEPNPYLCDENVIPEKPKPLAKELKEKALADLLWG